MTKFYAVKKGFKTGVFNTWEECKLYTYGYSNACFKLFKNYEEACAFINDIVVEIPKTLISSKEKVKQVTWNFKDCDEIFKTSNLKYDTGNLNVIHEPKKIYIYCDGCCNKKLGSYASVFGYCDGLKWDLIKENTDILCDMIIDKVHISYGETYVVKCHFDDVKSQQNNGCELISMIISLRIALKHNIKTIFSDSQLIVNHWSKKLSKTVTDEYKLKYNMECIYLRTQFELQGGKIIKIDANYGNCADLDCHRS